MSNFRKFGTFRTPHGWLTTTGDGEILQRGTKRGESEAPVAGADWLQFEVTVEQTNRLRIKKGVVIAGLGKFASNYYGPDGPKICNRQFYINSVFSTPLSSTIGAQTQNWIESEYVNQNGYVTLPASPANGSIVSVWISRNLYTVGAGYGRLTTQEGFPLLIVDSFSGPLDLATRPWGTNYCDMIQWHQLLETYEFDPPTLQGTPTPLFGIMAWSCHIKNYNCQRFRIADIKYESGAWKVYQFWQGTVTLPHPMVYSGLHTGSNFPYWSEGPVPESIPAWKNSPENSAEQENWEDVMALYDKGHAFPTVTETTP